MWIEWWQIIILFLAAYGLSEWRAAKVYMIAFRSGSIASGEALLLSLVANRFLKVEDDSLTEDQWILVQWPPETLSKSKK